MSYKTSILATLHQLGRYLIHHLFNPLVKWLHRPTRFKTGCKRCLQKIPGLYPCIQTLRDQIFLLYDSYLNHKPPMSPRAQQIHQRLIHAIQAQQSDHHAHTD